MPDPFPPVKLLLKRAGPPVAAFVLLASYVAAEALGYRGLAIPTAQTVSEAVVIGNAARALELIAEGQDPNARSHVREAVFDGHTFDLLPLEAAILGRRKELFSLLLRSGAVVTDRAHLACLARVRLPEALPLVDASSEGIPDTIEDPQTAFDACRVSPR